MIMYIDSCEAAKIDILNLDTVKPVFNDHLYNKIHYL